MRAKKQLEFSPDAIDDIAEIEGYLIDHEEQRAAVEIVATIFSGAEVLESNPEVGRRGTIEGTRELVIKRYPYTLIYKLTPSKAIVLNVLHQSRQYP